MNSFNPPVKKVQLGLLRNIELFDFEEYMAQKEDFEYLINTERVKKTFNDSFVAVIGLVNNSDAILYDPEEILSGVYVDSTHWNEDLVKVADNLEKFYKIIMLLKEAWSGQEQSISLKKTPENLAMRKHVISQIAEINPESNVLFWDHLAFRELDLGMHL